MSDCKHEWEVVKQTRSHPICYRGRRVSTRTCTTGYRRCRKCGEIEHEEEVWTETPG